MNVLLDILLLLLVLELVLDLYYISGCYGSNISNGLFPLEETLELDF